MDKNEVIKILLNEQTCVKTADTCDRDCAKCSLVMDSEKIIEAYNLAIKLLSEQRWVPCSERLPEVGEDVLFSVGGMYVAEGCLREDGDWVQFRWSAIQPKDVVGAWRRLPDPWEGEQP